MRHASVRTQFGQPVGTFQAVKHKLADVAIALEFARPLLDAAATAITDDTLTAPRDVSAAKVACADAATLAARSHSGARRDRIHGRARPQPVADQGPALAPAWGSQAWHRQRVLAALATSPAAAPGGTPVGLTVEQLDLRDAVRGLIATTERVVCLATTMPGNRRRRTRDPRTVRRRRRRAGRDLRRHGGTGQRPHPAPMLGSVVLAAQAVLASGDEAASERLLPRSRTAPRSPPWPGPPRSVTGTPPSSGTTPARSATAGNCAAKRTTCSTAPPPTCCWSPRPHRTAPACSRSSPSRQRHPRARHHHGRHP